MLVEITMIPTSGHLQVSQSGSLTSLITVSLITVSLITGSLITVSLIIVPLIIVIVSLL